MSTETNINLLKINVMPLTMYEELAAEGEIAEDEFYFAPSPFPEEGSITANTGCEVSGLLKGAAGKVAPAQPGADYYAPGGADIPISDGGTGASTVEAARNNLNAQMKITALGMLKGGGAGAVAAATPGEDYALPPLRFSNTSVAASAFVADAAYADYPFRAAMALTGVTAAMAPEVIFAMAEATGGNFAPVAESYNGGVYVYAKAVPAGAMVIPTILVHR